MTTTTTGTGTLTLCSAVTKYATFAESGAQNGDVVSYCIEEGDDFEVGRGTYTAAGTTLSRDSVLLSKIGGASGNAKMSLTGTAHVFITALAEDISAIADDAVTNAKLADMAQSTIKGRAAGAGTGDP